MDHYINNSGESKYVTSVRKCLLVFLALTIPYVVSLIATAYPLSCYLSLSGTTDVSLDVEREAEVVPKAAFLP